jgi:4-hydroxy-tetrahydrodipicolinate reductase
MGRMVAEEAARAGLAVVGGTDRPGAHLGELPCFPTLSALAEVADVLVDFSHASAVAETAATLARHRAGWVLGTTGIDAEDQARVARTAESVPVVQAANFSPAVTLMMALARRMAATLPAARYDAEILEMHHRHKVDAPSGTALALGEAVAAGRGVSLAAMRDSGRDGQTGARRPGAIGFAALRGGQVVGEHTLLFAADDEQIALVHRAFDRRAFAAGAVRAVQWLHGRLPGLYGMEHVLGLDIGT